VTLARAVSIPSLADDIASRAERSLLGSTNPATRRRSVPKRKDAKTSRERTRAR
jgi:hypothetical protein